MLNYCKIVIKTSKKVVFDLFSVLQPKPSEVDFCNRIQSVSKYKDIFHYINQLYLKIQFLTYHFFNESI